jgi:hypothetical protein
MAEYQITFDTVRDLIHCVQAARDAAPEQSLFAMQCDMVLARAAEQVPGVIVPRGPMHTAAEAFSERRASVRFPLQRGLRYKVLNGLVTAFEGTGQTLDFSSTGVVFTGGAGELRVGMQLELAIDWPVQLENGCRLQFLATGRVVRSDFCLAALRFERYDFRTSASNALQVLGRHRSVSAGR